MEFKIAKNIYDTEYLDNIIDKIFNWGIKNCLTPFYINVVENDKVIVVLHYENLFHFLWEEPYKQYFAENYIIKGE